jgi:hypothetical protein
MHLPYELFDKENNRPLKKAHANTAYTNIHNAQQEYIQKHHQNAK